MILEKENSNRYSILSRLEIRNWSQ